MYDRLLWISIGFVFGCSDGCGRTGTFVAIYYTIERLKVEGTVDIFQAIKNSRLSRSDLVSSLVSTTTYVCVVYEAFISSFPNSGTI